MSISLRFLVFVPLAVVLLVPSVALGCTRLNKPIAPTIPLEDLRFAHLHRGTRSAWLDGENWEASRVQFSQLVRVCRACEGVPAAYAQQEVLRVVAFRPGAGRYSEDPDPATTCELAGQPTWGPTRFLVKETDRAIFVTAVNRHSDGSSVGCLITSSDCDDMNFIA